MAGMSDDGVAPRLDGMLILAVAAFLGDQIPAICFNKPEYVADFHEMILAHFLFHLLLVSRFFFNPSNSSCSSSSLLA